jgi:Paired amphipathic helix repeat
VSMLFHGNPYLIEGFNTFLPPGYHINASTDPRDPNLITVTTPLGTMTSKIGAGVGGSSYFGSPLPFGPPAAGSRPESPLARLHPPQTFSPAPQGLTTAVASVLGNMGNKTQVERAPAAEFDHAILYLNKIKTRYPDDQNNTYKQFLEILQTYRKEQQNSLKDPIGYQQREQRMMHDVRILSYLEGNPSHFCSAKKRRSLFHRFISRCRCFLKTKKISSANSKTFCRRSQAHLPRVVSSVSAPIHPTVRMHRAQCGRMKLRRRLLAYQKALRPLRADENESSRKSLQNRASPHE